MPRHQAGSEIYALELCRELAARHHVSVLCGEYDPLRPHGHLTWRVYKGLPVIELVNNWVCGSFEQTYRSPLVTDRIAHVLRAVQPDIIHVHNLLNLSLDLPDVARARGVPVVATLHDYALVCPSGGQRIHRAERHVCDVIDTERCVRCFRESPFPTQISAGRLAGVARVPRLTGAAVALSRRFPRLAARFARGARHASLLTITKRDVDQRLVAARRVFEEIDLFVAPSPSIAAEFQRLGIRASKIRISDYGFVPLVSRPSDSWRKSRSAAPGWQGVTSEHTGSIRARSNAASRDAPPRSYVTNHWDGTLGRQRNGHRPPGEPLRIGYVGTLVWHKGVHVLLGAIRGLPTTGYELKIFGNPDVFPEYTVQLRAQAAGLPVRFMGSFNRERTGHVYAEIDVLVVPSLWLENSPLVIHEAFMAGIPVVGARIGGIADLVDDGRTGLLYDPSSPTGLEAILRRLIGNPERPGERGELAELAEHVRASPPVKSIAEDARDWEDTYEHILRRRAGGGHGR